MDSTFGTIFICAALFVSMSAASFTGLRIARKRPHTADGSMLVNAIFALLGLLVAFTFSAAFARLDSRRKLIGEEVNAIGTYSLRLDLLSPAARDSLREKLKRYTLERGRVYQLLGDAARSSFESQQANALQQQIWAETIAACHGASSEVPLLILPALNAVIDITTTRAIAIGTHSPFLVFFTLFAMALICAGLAAYSSQQTLQLVHLMAFSAVMAFTLYVILDVEFPHQGLVTLNSANRLLFDLAAGIR